MPPEITDIRSCWERIRPGLEVIRRKTRAEWRPEDVYAKCVAGEWTLFTEEGVDGFLVLCQTTGEFTGEKRLFVVCAYYRGEQDPFSLYEPFLCELARTIAARAIEFRTPRLGYRRKGWDVAKVTYRREVDDE